MATVSLKALLFLPSCRGCVQQAADRSKPSFRMLQAAPDTDIARQIVDLTAIRIQTWLAGLVGLKDIASFDLKDTESQSLEFYCRSCTQDTTTTTTTTTSTTTTATAAAAAATATATAIATATATATATTTTTTNQPQEQQRQQQRQRQRQRQQQLVLYRKKIYGIVRFPQNNTGKSHEIRPKHQEIVLFLNTDNQSKQHPGKVEFPNCSTHPHAQECIYGVPARP